MKMFYAKPLHRARSILCAAFVWLGHTEAQNFHPHYQDGKIWFKLKNDVPLAASLIPDPNNLPLEEIPFLMKYREEFKIRRLSQPFFAAKDDPGLLRTFLLEFDEYQRVEELIRLMEGIKGVEYAEKVPLDKLFLTPNDPSYSSQWGLAKINAPGAWDFFSAGSTIVIAIVDDAVQRSHPDLQPNLWVNPGEIPNNNVDDDGNGYIDDINGYDVGSNDNNPDPPSSSYGHGTHVAGIASARSNNGVGVASIGFSCKLMCVKATNTASSISNGYGGIVYAAASGAKVINCSWGGPGASTTGQNVINYAWNKGCIIVAAAGNDNVSTPFYPAAYNNVIAVASTSSSDAKSSFSNYGTWIDIAAPGSNIFSTTVNSSYGNMSGTSMASPMVAGLVGLMWSLNPGLPRASIINCLTSTATNINAQNPNFTGQLGAGRINAQAAMQCVAATLNNPPQAEFTANTTTIFAGGSVTFTDLSTFNPTSWSWSFPGGTPSSFNGQNPPAITYNNPGVYNVTLTVSNANGSDTEVKTNYITVNNVPGCTGINYPPPLSWNLVNYYTGSSPGANGWVNGVNSFGDKQKAMYFDASSLPYTHLVDVFIGFGRAYSANPNKIVPIRVYDGTAGPNSPPGAQLGFMNLTMGQIMSAVNAGNYTYADFADPIPLPASKRFFISVDMSNLQWTTTVKDTLSIVSNTDGQTTDYPVWEQQSNNQWYRYGSAGSFNLNISLLIHPFLTSQPAYAMFSQSAATACTGESVTFDASGSVAQTALQWSFPGASPSVVNNNFNPTVFFNTPGTHTVKLYVIGGGCDDLDSAWGTITIFPTPSVSVNATNTEICPGGSVTLTASGASTYTWSPGTSLNTTSGSTVVATPSSTTTYTVTGTSNSCSSSATIQIVVRDLPDANVTTSPTTITCKGTVTFDASQSEDVTTFAWSFPGGTPSSSNASVVEVTYNNEGTFPASLVASNLCGSDNSFSVNVVVNGPCNVGLDESEGITGLQAKPTGTLLWIEGLKQGQPGRLSLINHLGQIVHQINLTGQSSTLVMPSAHLATGIYYLVAEYGSERDISKVIIP